jgi:hypothetical protein
VFCAAAEEALKPLSEERRVEAGHRQADMLPHRHCLRYAHIDFLCTPFPTEEFVTLVQQASMERLAT